MGQDWVEDFYTAIIPLKKNDNPKMRKFLNEHIKNGAIYLKQLNCGGSISPGSLNCINNNMAELKGQYMAIIECTDSLNRY